MTQNVGHFYSLTLAHASLARQVCLADLQVNRSVLQYVTLSGRQWIVSLYSNIFRAERDLVGSHTHATV